jgi:hypothetical protein
MPDGLLARRRGVDVVQRQRDFDELAGGFDGCHALATRGVVIIIDIIVTTTNIVTIAQLLPITAITPITTVTITTSSTSTTTTPPSTAAESERRVDINETLKVPERIEQPVFSGPIGFQTWCRASIEVGVPRFVGRIGTPEEPAQIGRQAVAAWFAPQVKTLAAALDGELPPGRELVAGNVMVLMQHAAATGGKQPLALRAVARFRSGLGGFQINSLRAWARYAAVSLNG